MSAVPILIYSIYLFTYKINTTNYFNIFIIVIFVVILFLKSSATLIAGSFFSILAVILFEYKRLNKYFIFFGLSLIIFLIVIFLSDKVCKNKLVLNQDNKIKLEKINPFSKTKKLENFTSSIENLNNNLNTNIQEKIFSFNLEIEKILSDASISNK